MYLTEQDIKVLTECEQRAAQIRWLRKNNFVFAVTAAGNIRLTWEHHNARLNPSNLQPTPVEPNWGAL